MEVRRILKNRIFGKGIDFILKDVIDDKLDTRQFPSDWWTEEFNTFNGSCTKVENENSLIDLENHV